jgi:hypothetical protein
MSTRVFAGHALAMHVHEGGTQGCACVLLCCTTHVMNGSDCLASTPVTTELHAAAPRLMHCCAAWRMLGCKSGHVRLPSPLGVFLTAGTLWRRVAVVERGPLRGRAQEWNISRKELRELVSARVGGRDVGFGAELMEDVK